MYLDLWTGEQVEAHSCSAVLENMDYMYQEIQILFFLEKQTSKNPTNKLFSQERDLYLCQFGVKSAVVL